MKNYDSKFSPFLGAGILGFVTPAAVYLIGLFGMLVWSVISLALFPFYYGGHLKFDAFTNVAVIAAVVLQVLAIVILTLVLSVFGDLKIYHLPISAAVSSGLFFIVERFIHKIRWVNFPWVVSLFPKIFAKHVNSFDSLANSQFIELRLYLPTTLILTGTFFAVSLITWGIYRAASHKKKRGSQAELPKEEL